MSDTTGNLQYGTDTLEVISAATKFNQWMYDTIKPFCKGNILEIGSGIGNISQFFVSEGANITLSDFDTGYFNRLKEKFGEKQNMKGIHHIDLSVKNPEELYPGLINKFDTVFALNVVEHIEDQQQALLNAHTFLREGGRVVILVPAFKWLYNSFDKQLGHYRRYTKGSLQNLIRTTGFEVIYAQYFNSIGTVGWFMSGNIMKKKMIPQGQMKLYDSLVPFWKLIDKFTNPFIGLSVISVGKKKHLKSYN